MPERISDNWVGVISIDVASRVIKGSWNEPVVTVFRLTLPVSQEL